MILLLLQMHVDIFPVWNGVKDQREAMRWTHAAGTHVNSWALTALLFLLFEDGLPDHDVAVVILGDKEALLAVKFVDLALGELERAGPLEELRLGCQLRLIDPHVVGRHRPGREQEAVCRALASHDVRG